MVIGIDIDGVLARFNPAYARLLTKESGINFPDFNLGEPETWNWERDAGVTYEQETRVWEGIKRDRRFWFSLDPTPEAPEFLSKLDMMEHETYFITDRTGWMPQYQSTCWLEQWFGQPSVIISKKIGKGKICQALGIEVFIDDKVENIKNIWEHSPSTEAFVLKKPYNKELHESVNLVNGLEEFADRTRLWRS